MDEIFYRIIVLYANQNLIATLAQPPPKNDAARKHKPLMPTHNPS